MYCQKVIGHKTIFGSVNDRLLAQSYLEGAEYAVNSVSYEGKHTVTDIWRYRKNINPEGHFLYDRTTLESLENPQLNALNLM